MKRKFTVQPSSITAASRKENMYNGKKFDWYQMSEIRRGLESGFDVSVYADPKFEGGQMMEIREGLKSGVDISIYADPKFDWQQMYEIRKGLESGVDISIYADPKFTWKQMEKIREGLEKGVDVDIKSIKNDEDDRDYEYEGFDATSAISAIASTLGVPENLASTIYHWYDLEGSTEDFNDVDDFIDYVQSDIYDMLDACTDQKLKDEIESYLY